MDHEVCKRYHVKEIALISVISEIISKACSNFNQKYYNQYASKVLQFYFYGNVKMLVSHIFLKLYFYRS